MEPGVDDLANEEDVIAQRQSLANLAVHIGEGLVENLHGEQIGGAFLHEGALDPELRERVLDAISTIVDAGRFARAA